MGKTNAKKDILSQISILKTTSELSADSIRDRNLLFDSITSLQQKNSNDPFLFVVDLLTTLVGFDSHEVVIKDILKSVEKLDKKYKTILKDELLSNIGTGEVKTPANLINGYKVHINKVDYLRNLYIDDKTPQYRLINDAFNQKLLSVVKTPNTTVNLTPSMNVSFDNATGFLTVKSSAPNLNFKDIISDYIDSITLLNVKDLFSFTLTGMFNKGNLTKEQIQLKEEMNIIVNKLSIEEEDNYFEFSDAERKTIEERKKSSDLITNIGCGFLTVNVSIDDMETEINKLAYPISEQKIATALTNLSNVVVENSGASETAQNEKQSIRNSFFSRFLLELKNNVLSNILVAPKVNLLFALVDSYKLNEDVIFDPINDIKKRKNLIQCLGSKVLGALVKALMVRLKNEILKVVASVSIMYIQESADKFAKILASVIKRK